MKELQYALLILAAVGLGIALIGFGNFMGTTRARQEAISHGAAYWAVNPTNGTVTFTWKGSKE